MQVVKHLDWFWSGWFYGTDPVDISLDSVKWLKADMQNLPEKIDSIKMQSYCKSAGTCVRRYQQDQESGR